MASDSPEPIKLARRGPGFRQALSDLWQRRWFKALAVLAAIGLLYLLLSGMGLLAPISEMIGGADSISAGLVLGLTAAVGALWWVLSIGFMALGAVIYNACGGLVGGLKISLADDS